MNRRECLFFGKQTAALFRLIPNVLCQLIVLCEGRAQRIQRGVQAFLALAEIPQLITEHKQIFAQILHGLGKRREGIFDCLRQLFDLSSQLPEQGIVCLDLPVQFTSVRDNTLFLHGSGNHPLMDRRLLQQPTLGMAAVVDAFFVPGALQIAVCHIRPCSPPQDKLLVAVPSFRDGILPAEFATFGVLGHPFIALCLRCGRGHIHLLFAHLVLVLFLPAVGLRLFELGGGKAPFLAIFDTEIFFLGLVLPFSLFIQRAHRQQDVGMGIVSGRIWVMDGSISAHSVCHKLLLDEILQKLDLFFPAQFYGQRRHKFTGQAAVLCFFVFLHSIPENAPILPFLWSIFGQKHLPPPKALFAGVVVLHPVVLVEHPGTAQIGRSSHGGASSSTADYLGLQMINRHCLPSFLKGYCETQQPFFRTRLQ